MKYLNEYKLRIKFSDSIIKEVDLKEELYGDIFEPLKEISYFKQVKVNPDITTIEWFNWADFAPEFLYEKGELYSKSA